ncbi:hypothetical protein TRFO_23414 [Tritrichomonas foetus]|uniref:CUE domain-containing protein n=1 Tax=Tritrichomonas foetus TaxID=1144522 RepID=A0A1J4KA93_9EUKA|nr:hypothetical protein TRFO_23414 [Tritrichomonas foetus]|eukprot:OHT08139.1 hypothetical protein TRFO_23414 [Tritrichomonas foetus]
MSQGMIHSLQEMFPNHSVGIIERVVQETRGSTEAAINKLLSIPADRSAPSQGHFSRPAQRQQQPPPPERTSDHIFPEDFLRWPKNVEWVCVSSEISESPLQTDDDVINPHSADGIMPPLPNNATIQKGGFDQTSGWSKLKSRFMSMGPGYNQI